MKTFSYQWTPEYYLLHLQFVASGKTAYQSSITRSFSGGKPLVEAVPVLSGVESHRIMVSRAHPKETGFLVEYPDDVRLEVFQLDDRAYYPTETFFAG
ncbi:MAG: hypothetical protein HQM09_12880 [Candidatus Riflebacteria bacterium]|nr:hypothetical protein [Candidatus Riflebacteria bacterium]